MRLSISLACFAQETEWEIPKRTQLQRGVKGHGTWFVLPGFFCVRILIHFAAALPCCSTTSTKAAFPHPVRWADTCTAPSWAALPPDLASSFILNGKAKHYLNTWSNKDYGENGEKHCSSLRSKCGDECAAQGEIWEQLCIWGNFPAGFSRGNMKINGNIFLMAVNTST